MNVVQLLHASVVRDPSHACLKFKRDGQYETLTYAEVWQRILRFASALQHLGVQPGDSVAIMAETSPAWMICDFAILSLGAVVVPVYPSLPPAEAAYILQNADAAYFIADHAAMVADLEGAWPHSLRAVIVLNGDTTASSKPVYEFSSLLEDDTYSPVDPAVIDRIPTDSLATIVHTSGTSGRPKGVMLSHRNITSNLEACLAVTPVHRDDVTLSYLPLSHILERTVGHYCVLTAGATIAYAEGIEHIQENLREVSPTLLVTVPRLLEKVYTGIQQKVERAPRPIRHLLRSSARHSPLRRTLANALVYTKLRAGFGGRMRGIISGGAGLAQSIAAFYQEAGIPVCEGYGMTETAPVIAVNRLDDIHPGTVGRPLPNVEVLLAADGELLVRGPNVMRGYYHDPLSTDEAIDREGWLHTGDIAAIEGGYVRIVERKKHLIVLATGKNVSPFPIENAISLSPYIAEAVLVGDERKYVTCLLVPDFAALSSKASQSGLGESDFSNWLNHPDIRRLLQREVQTAVAQFTEFERPKRALLIASPFSLDSGELTPTLKVKAKLVTQKYQTAIDQMYEGIGYLDIYGSPELGLEQGAAHVESDVVDPPLQRRDDGERELSAPAEKRRRPTRWMWTTVASLVVACALCGVAAAKVHVPKSLDLLGTIRNVHHNNDQINLENRNIVDGMNTVKNLSSLTPQMAGQLSTLDAGLIQQNHTLQQLTDLSEQEIGLSHQFGSVAASLHGNLSSISQTTSQQSNSVSAMRDTAATLASRAAAMEKTNQQMAQKLQQATGTTQQISTEVP